MIVITSKREGFRRCGVAHAAGPTQWPDDRWTGAELAALMAEPMLTVAQAADDPPADATPPPLGLVEIDQPGTEFNSVPREVNADPAVIEVDRALGLVRHGHRIERSGGHRYLAAEVAGHTVVDAVVMPARGHPVEQRDESRARQRHAEYRW